MSVEDHMYRTRLMGWETSVDMSPLCFSNEMLLTANVFPEPVCATPTIFLPLRAIGQPWAWIGVGDS